MRPMFFILAALVSAHGMTWAADRTGDAELRKEFANPPLCRQSRPLWFWNGPLNQERTRGQLEGCKERGYGGVGILPAQNMKFGFMTPEFLAQFTCRPYDDAFPARGGNIPVAGEDTLSSDGLRLGCHGGPSPDAASLRLRERGSPVCARCAGASSRDRVVTWYVTHVAALRAHFSHGV